MDEPIVTRRVRAASSWTLESYLDSGGYDGLRRALAMSPDEVQAEVSAAALMGRGGAGFEAGKKWAMLREARPTYVVVNGDESEPCTFKDHMLMEADPHQIVEGALICAYAVGASRVFIYVRGEFALAMERLTEAVNDAYELGAIGQGVFGSAFSVDVAVHPGAGAYICGEETALLESLEGKRGFPRIKPPYYPAVIGLYGAPTIVNNVETLSNLPWIVLNGGAAFAALGAEQAAGSRIFSLSGHVKRPGNYELVLGRSTFRDLIYDPSYGGGVVGDRELKAFLPGGSSFPWFGPEHLDVTLAEAHAKKAQGPMVGGGGSSLGSGSVVAMDETTCMVRVAWRLAKFYRRESCGQCTPCREGTGWLEKTLFRIETGSGRREDLELLQDVSDNLAPGLAFPYPMTTICVLGPSSAVVVVSAISMFRDEFLVHIKERACPFST